MKNMKEYCQQQIKTGKEAKEILIKDIKKNPLWALEWSQGHIENITMARLCENILNNLENSQTEKQIINDLRENLINDSQWLNQSTCPITNLLNDIEQMVKGQFLDRIGYAIDLKKIT